MLPHRFFPVKVRNGIIEPQNNEGGRTDEPSIDRVFFPRGRKLFQRGTANGRSGQHGDRRKTALSAGKRGPVQNRAYAEGRKDFFNNPVLNEVGKKYGKSAAQTALRYLIQMGVVVILKSTHKERMIQNPDVFDFALAEEDMAAIRALDEGESLFFSHYDPDTVEYLTGLVR